MFAYCRNNPVKRRDITGFGDKEDADGDGDFFEIEEYGGGGGSRYAYGGDGSYWSSCTTGGGAAGCNYSNVRTPNQQALADLAKEVNYNARHGQFISYGVPLEIGASGEMNLMVNDSRKLLLKLVGTTNGIAWEGQNGAFTKSLAASFRPLISMTVKSNLSTCIKGAEINILEVDEHLGTLSEALKKPICAGFEEYGLTIPEFYVTNVVLPENDPGFKRIRDLHTITLQTKVIQAEATVKTAQAQSEAAYRTAQEQSKAAIAAAERQVELERQTTETEIAHREAERSVIRAQAEAQAQRMAGLTEAEIMRAKGYNQKDVLQAEVQKAYAEGLGNMTISGSGGSVAGDMIGLGVGMAAAGAVNGQVGNLFKGFGTPAAEEATAKATCPNCHAEVPNGSKFCLECGGKIESLRSDEMICPTCGKKTHKGKFCMECGAPLVRRCGKCGADLPENAKFCLECGERI